MIPEHETNTEQLRRRNRELSILNEIAEALNRETDLAQALHTTLEKVVALFDLQTGWIWLLNEETTLPYLAAARHLPPALLNDPRAMDGERYCYCLDEFEEGELASAENVSIITCTRLKDLVKGTDGLRYHTSIPLIAHGKRLGLLNVVSADWSELTEDELKLLHTVGDLVSIAIERVRLFERSANLGALEERNRLAREIHDTLAQGLTAISLRLETADALLDSGADTERLRSLIHQTLELTQQSLEDARRSVMDLRAAPLEGRSLAEAVESLLRSMADSHGLEARFSAREQRPLSPRLEAGLYRIAQETLNNVINHAQASHVAVELLATPDVFTLIVEDDGIGFDPEECMTDNRFGLVGLNERVKLLHGQLQISSTPGEGTHVKVTVPLEEPA